MADLVAKAKAREVQLIFPVDFVCGDAFSPEANLQVVDDASGIPAGWEGLDAGPKSIALYRAAIHGAKTIIWNGPPGVFEFEKFSGASKAMAEAVAEATAQGATTVVGGGDTATAAKNSGWQTKSAIAPRAAGPVWHSSRARCFRVWQPWPSDRLLAVFLIPTYFSSSFPRPPVRADTTCANSSIGSSW